MKQNATKSHQLLLACKVIICWRALTKRHIRAAGQDYLFTYKSGIEAVTAEDVLGAAQRHLHPSQQTVVLAADASAVKQSLEEHGRRVILITVD